MIEESHPKGGGGSSGITPSAIRIPREKLANFVLARGEGGLKGGGQLIYPKFRIVTSNQKALDGHLAFKIASNRNLSTSESSGRRGSRQDPLLLMDPDSTIPNLLDLTQQDCEVNAPANHSLLQGVDLLMALDQSL